MSDAKTDEMRVGKRARVGAPPRYSAAAKRTPRGEMGWAEPGFRVFADYRERCGTAPETVEQYAEFLGSVRAKAGKALLDLSVDELRALDKELLSSAQCYRTVLRMFYQSHRRHDLLDEMPRQRRQKKRRAGLEEILTPADVDELIAACTSKRDRAIIAVLASTGGRVNEVLRLKVGDLKATNGDAVQPWFGTTKVRSEERFGPKIAGPWKGVLDEWLAAHPIRGDPAAWLFPSSVDLGVHVEDGTVGDLLRSLAKRAGITKPVHAHAFRHARVTWGILDGEDTAKLSVAIWGQPRSTMLNRYSHWSGADVQIGAPAVRDLPDVPALPVPPILSTQERVAALTDENASLKADIAELRAGLEIVVSQLALDRGVPVGTKLTVDIEKKSD